MTANRGLALLWAGGWLALAAPVPARAADLVFEGACDASAGWALDGRQVAIAGDEDDILRIYAPDGGRPVGHGVDLDPLLAQESPRKEADLEAVARLGDRLFWIGSHGRDSRGGWEPDRQRLVSTSVYLEPSGRAVDLEGALRQAGLDAALGKAGRKDPALAPERKGLNIEGLAAAPDGTSLLLGLRSPLTQAGQAQLVRFRNPVASVEGGAAPLLDAPFALDLDGLGIRDMIWSPEQRRMLIVAGPSGGEGGFALYAWSGQVAAAPEKLMPITGMRPEAIVLVPGRDGVLLLSDDGDEPHQVAEAQCKKGEWNAGACPCKALKGDARSLQQFRGRWVALP